MIKNHYKDKVNYLNYKDNKGRRFFRLRELSIFITKCMSCDTRISYGSRLFLKFYFFHARYISITKLRRRCFLTGRSRFIFSFCHLSRSSFKQLLARGFLSGFYRQ